MTDEDPSDSAEQARMAAEDQVKEDTKLEVRISMEHLGFFTQMFAESKYFGDPRNPCFDPHYFRTRA